MGIFGRRIDIKNATKTTYSDEDLRKLDLNYRNEFQIDREKRIYTPFRKEMPSLAEPDPGYGIRKDSG